MLIDLTAGPLNSVYTLFVSPVQRRSKLESLLLKCEQLSNDYSSRLNGFSFPRSLVWQLVWGCQHFESMFFNFIRKGSQSGQLNPVAGQVRG
jgi:hypothetical protein